MPKVKFVLEQAEKSALILEKHGYRRRRAWLDIDLLIE